MRRDLPAGTVTFLFTDIEGSTRLLRELGALGYAEALAEHRRILRASFAAHGGVEVDTQGDAFFVAFPTATGALGCAVESQRALERGPIKVRMGLHTGTPFVAEEGYVGADVNRAARIAAVGYGGQVLVSASTASLVGTEQLRDLGDHRLKDLSAPERIYQLGDEQFAPLNSLNATNLPVATNPLVGRRRELEELQALLRGGARLVTVTGTGGTGKTRLGMQAAAELVGDFPGGVFFVPLAGVRDAGLVAATVAATVGVADIGELREREALLVLDNFEHLLDAAPIIAALLSTAPRIKVLATSRAPLRVEGEREYPLDPLPDADAVELLTARAAAVGRDAIADDVALEIARRLDGLPLALELAASRLRTLGASALLARLERRLPVLTGGRRDAPARHRTLRATIEWSYDLLDPELQRLFARLAVFSTFALEAAEEVADATLDDVDALVEASLLKPLAEDRFLMLETIREFALERLDESGEADDIRLRHAEFLLRIAQRAGLTTEAEGPMRHDLVIPEHDNVRAALAWTIGTGRGELGLRIATALENFWVASAIPGEGRQWLETLIPLGPPAPTRLHAHALRALAMVTSDPAVTERLLEEAAAEFRAVGDEPSAANTAVRVAYAAFFRGDDVRARQIVAELLPVHVEKRRTRGEATCTLLLGDLERRNGALEKAVDLYERSVALLRETGLTYLQRGALGIQAEVLLELGRPEEATRRAVEAVELSLRMGDRAGTLWALTLVAAAAAEQGDPGRAGRLSGTVAAELERAPVPEWDDLFGHLERVEQPISEDTRAVFEGGRAAGRLLTLDEAVAIALGTAPAPS